MKEGQAQQVFIERATVLVLNKPFLIHLFPLMLSSTGENPSEYTLTCITFSSHSTHQE